jgi:predicted 3-demethylubiquinone-9 3-methyltransferase (glyoxalase superfamily)
VRGGPRARRQRPDRRLHPRGQAYTAINGGPEFPFNEAVSLLIICALINDEDQARAQRAMKAMLGMKKIDVAALYAAADPA